jgi:ankyrin repeat protein
MSPLPLPDHASLEYLRKLAKERLRDLRQKDSGTRLTEAQFAVARDYGFSSWRALKAEIDRRRSPLLEMFFAACAAGDDRKLNHLLAGDAALTRERTADGATGLHLAVGHPEAVRLLLSRGADPNARDVGDNALPLHFAAGGGVLPSALALLEAGSDVHGVGDVHRLEVIGWATVFDEYRRDMVDLLLAHGARHHVFSAIASGDRDLLQRVVEDDPDAIRRRLSRFEQEQTALHYVVAPPDGLVGGRFRTGHHYSTLDLLLELGAELEATDAKGRTPLAVAMLRSDHEAMRRLHAAGARTPEPVPAVSPAALSDLADSVERLTPMLGSGDLEATVAWYRSLGFKLAASHEDRGRMDWARLRLGQAEIMLTPPPHNRPGTAGGVSLWLKTSRLDDLYVLLRDRQHERGRALLQRGTTDIPEVRFTQDLYTAFYGQREFSIRDPNGVDLCFFQPVE